MSGDPTNWDSIGDAGSSEEAAQWWLLFAIMVANKNAEQTKRKLDRLLSWPGPGFFPFSAVGEMIRVGSLRLALVEARTGQYNRIEKAFRYVFNDIPNDPRCCAFEDLEAIPGVGPKTARWFWLLIHPDAEVAALDTHVLKFLACNSLTVPHEALPIPSSTPPAGAKYRALEAVFVAHAKRLGMKPRDLDFFVWAAYRNGYHLQAPCP